MMSPELEAMYQRERARQRESERQAALHRLSDQRSRIQNSLETGPLTFPPLGATLEAIRQSIRLGFQRAIQDLSLSPPDSLPVSTPVSPPVDPDARWRGVIVPPAVVLILGKRGGGKSALAYRLLELFQYQLTPFVVGAPSRSQRLFPEWIGICPSLDELPQDCIALVDEAYLLYHSRQSSAATSRDMSQQLNLSRQRNQTLLFVSQEARQVDKNIVSSASVLVFKDLGMLQPDFDRPELRKLVIQAKEAMDTYRADKKHLAYVYSPDADHLGMLTNQLPSFWKPSLSRIFSTEPTSQASRPGVKTSAQDRAKRAKELRKKGYSYRQIASELGVTKGTVANYLKGYPYK